MKRGIFGGGGGCIRGKCNGDGDCDGNGGSGSVRESYGGGGSGEGELIERLEVARTMVEAVGDATALLMAYFFVWLRHEQCGNGVP